MKLRDDAKIVGVALAQKEEQPADESEQEISDEHKLFEESVQENAQSEEKESSSNEEQ